MIQNIVTLIYSTLRNELPTTYDVQMSYPSNATKFPVITVEETSNEVNLDTISSGGQFATNITIEINIFTHGNLKVIDAYNIREKVENEITSNFGLIRTFGSPTPNFLDNEIYRYTMRYSFTLDKNKTVYRR